MKKVVSIIIGFILLTIFPMTSVKADEKYDNGESQGNSLSQSDAEMENAIKTDNIDNMEEVTIPKENADDTESSIQKDNDSVLGDYVIWGSGRGITDDTIQSGEDVFTCVDELDQKAVSDFQVYKEEDAWLFESCYGKYQVKMPILNAYIAANGMESLGVPQLENKK